MNINYLGASGFLSALILLNGCSTLSVKKEDMTSIKKVAITGFGSTQDMPAGLVFSLGSKSESPGSNLTVLGPEEEKHVNQMYQDLATTLEKNLKWNVLSRDDVAHSSRYKNIYTQKMEGWHSRPVAGENTHLYHPSGIADAWIMRQLDQKERDQLIDELNVDALILASVRVTLEDQGGLKKLVGAGELHPKASLYFEIYKKGIEEPVWRDTWARGESTSEGVGHILGVTDVDALKKASIVAAWNSYQVLIQRYREL